MTNVINQLHKEFTELIAGKAMDNWWFGNSFAERYLEVNRDTKMAPAFFIEEPTHPSPNNDIANQQVTDLKLPFESFWICTRWMQVGQESSGFVHFFRTHNVLKLAIYTCSGGKNAWSGRAFKFETNMRLVPEVTPIERIAIDAALHLVNVINLPIERIDAMPTILVRQKLAQGGMFRNQTRFITVRPSYFTSQRNMAYGSPKSPHNRRGHWRHYVSGKKTWVKDCGIRGGSKDARDYAM